jgi:ArsR family transcriptional regulator
MEINSAIGALAALAQDTRLRIFRMLVKICPEGLPAGEIAAELGIPNNTLSFHLNHLTQAGLISCTRSGRSLIYALNGDGIRELLAYLMEDCCQGRIDLFAKRDAEAQPTACCSTGPGEKANRQ